MLTQSTRVDGVILWETQATYDLLRWQEVFLDDFDLDLFAVAADVGLEQRLLSFYGITDVDELESEAIIAYRNDVDMLALMDDSDAPVWVDNSVEGAGFPLGVGALFHHPFHALSVRDTAIEAGIDVEANIPRLEAPVTTDVSAAAFARTSLGL